MVLGGTSSEGINEKSVVLGKADSETVCDPFAVLGTKVEGDCSVVLGTIDPKVMCDHSVVLGGTSSEGGASGTTPDVLCKTALEVVGDTT